VCSGKAFLFSLVAQLVTVPPSGHSFKREYEAKYRPIADYAIFKNGIPRFLAEFDSSSGGTDKECLLCQLACTTRLDAVYNDSQDSKDKILLMGAHFTKDWKIFRYFFYFKNNEVHSDASSKLPDNEHFVRSALDLLSSENIQLQGSS